MLGLRADSRFSRQVAARLADAPFRLIDIGFNGGVAPGWSVFGDHLRVLAVSGAATAGPDVGDIRVVTHDLSPRGPVSPTPRSGRFSVDRTLALRAGDASALETWLQEAIAAERQPAGGALSTALGAELDVLAQAEGFGDPDFLRLDASDADFEILAGLEPMLARGGPVGVGVRLRLFGGASGSENSFANMDRLLRRHGFQPTVFSPLNYSAAALPAPYMDRHPDHTVSGRPLVAVGIYVRDLAAMAGAAPASIAKSAALHALTGLPDLAAELLLAHRAALADFGVDVDAGLDLLALQAQEDYGTTWTYLDYVGRFERDDPAFYDVYGARERWMGNLLATAREAPLEIDRLSRRIRQDKRTLYAAAPRPRPSAETLQADAVRRGDIAPNDHWIFDYFESYRGPVGSEAYVTYAGDRISPRFEDWGPPPVDPAYLARIPVLDEEYFEWIDIAQAVLEAGPTFTMLELGAAYGRWSARGALLARQLGKASRLGLAEAEPKHQQWLREHMAANGVAADTFDTFDFAVSGSAGQVVFTVASPGTGVDETHYGHAVMAVDLAGAAPVGDYHGQPLYRSADGWGCIVVDQKPLSSVLAPYDVIDIIDFDLQGAEALAIAEALPQLTAKVRRLHIGTHGHDIEAELRSLLAGAGWICLRDFPCHGRHDTPFGPSDFVDGVQSWVNPSL